MKNSWVKLNQTKEIFQLTELIELFFLVNYIPYILNELFFFKN